MSSALKPISQRAKREGWTRDLGKQVSARVKQKLVDTQVDTPYACVREEEIVEEFANRGVLVAECHRRDVAKARDIAVLMMDELLEGTENRELVSHAVEKLAEVEAWDLKALNAALRAISLPTRAGTLRDISQALKSLQALERTGFNLNDKSDVDADDPLKQALEQAAGCVLLPQEPEC